MSAITKDVERHWIAIQPLFSIRNEKEYDQAIDRLDRLIDDVGTDVSHPLYSLLDTLGTLIHDYEEKHYPMPECSGSDVLQFLMEEHGLKASDLSEIGNIKTIQAMLKNEQELTLPQIRLLSERFRISPSVFI